nr:sugar kinase [Paenibacillus bovis]
MVDVVTIGESMILFQSLNDSSIQYSPLFTKSVAGAESNVAIGLTRLGKKVRWISKVGDDAFGKYLLATLAGEQVDVSNCIIADNEPTAIYFKDFKASQDPIVYYYRKGSAASKLNKNDIQPEWFHNARHLHVTGITPALSNDSAEMIIEAMKVAKRNHMTISFDPNIRRKLWTEEEARSTIQKMIPLCDIFMPGLEECEFLFGKKSTDEYGELLLNMGPRLILLKCGADGAMAYTSEYMIHKKGVFVENIVDTVGAGDAFATGSLSIILDLQNIDMELNNTTKIKSVIANALERGNRLGALAIQFKGDWEGLPTLNELTAIEHGESVITR